MPVDSISHQASSAFFDFFSKKVEPSSTQKSFSIPSFSIRNFFVPERAEDPAAVKRSLPPIPSNPPLPEPKLWGTIPFEKALTENSGEMNEAVVLALCLHVLGKQEELRNEGIKISERLIEHLGARSRTLMDRYNQLSKEIEEKAQKSGVLRWASFGAGAFSAVCAIGGTVVVIVSGGGALPAVLGTAAALSGTLGGISEISNALLQMEINKQQSESVKTVTARDISLEEINILLQNIQEDDQSVVALWSRRGEFARAVQNLTLSMLR